MNARILNPRLLLFMVVSLTTSVWLFFKPMMAFEKYVSLHAAANYFLFFLLIGFACFVTEKSAVVRPGIPSSEALEAFKKLHGRGNALRTEAMVLGLIALAAQALWIARIVQKAGFAEVIRLLFVDRDILTFKEQIVNATGISGITTLTQLDIAAASLYAIHVFGLQNRGKWGMWALILFPGVLRGLYFSERIAMLEVLVPIAVFAILFGRIKVTLTKIALALALFLFFFSAAEGLRSYAFYSKNGYAQESVWSYGLGRLGDYIGSSVNHSLAMADLSGRTIGFPSLPFSGWLNLLYTVMPEAQVRSFLRLDEAAQARLSVKNSAYSAPDYTNMGFFGEAFADAGYLYILHALLFGWFAGMAYKGIRHYRIEWMLVFPIVYFALLEIYRVPYLFDNRVFYPILYAALRWLFRTARRADAPAGRAAAERLPVAPVYTNVSSRWLERREST